MALGGGIGFNPPLPLVSAQIYYTSTFTQVLELADFTKTVKFRIDTQFYYNNVWQYAGYPWKVSADGIELSPDDSYHVTVPNGTSSAIFYMHTAGNAYNGRMIVDVT